MALEDNQLLFGSDPTDCRDRARRYWHGAGFIDAREWLDQLRHQEFHPVVWANGDLADLGLTNAEKLAGDAKYNWLVTIDSWKELIALRNGAQESGPQLFLR